MVQLSGTYATAHGSKYLQQLCKHFAHKVEVEHDATSGKISFPMGSARLSADDGGLTVRFQLENADDAERARMVIDKHLERFAFREEFKHMDWDAPV